MKKDRHYTDTLFAIEVIEAARQAFLKKIPSGKDFKERLSLGRGRDDITYDVFSEFATDYRSGFRRMYCAFSADGLPNLRVVITRFERGTGVEVEANTRGEVDELLAIFDRAEATSRVLPPPLPPPPPPVVFIGHGGSAAWRDLADHLRDQHGYDVQAYEVGARAGHTIRDILDDMLTKSSFAILVMTGEDATAAGKLHPRLNVVHELGLFQGRLGFSRAIVLLEDVAEEFSNIHGIHQIRFEKGRIRETYGDVLATLRREFKS